MDENDPLSEYNKILLGLSKVYKYADPYGTKCAIYDINEIGDESYLFYLYSISRKP